MVKACSRPRPRPPAPRVFFISFQALALLQEPVTGKSIKSIPLGSGIAAWPLPFLCSSESPMTSRLEPGNSLFCLVSTVGRSMVCCGRRASRLSVGCHRAYGYFTSGMSLPSPVKNRCSWSMRHARTHCSRNRNRRSMISMARGHSTSLRSSSVFVQSLSMPWTRALVTLSTAVRGIVVGYDQGDFF
jgi:hypothetical protein